MRITIVSLSYLLAPLALAHHSTAAFFDRDAVVEVEGTVVDVFWRNPHVGLTLEVENEAGETETWELEGGAMNTLRRRGFSETSVQIGDRVKAAGSPSRRGEPAVFVSHFLLANGEEVNLSDRELPPRWTSPAAVPVVADATVARGRGIFKVWGQREFNRLREPLVLTAAAKAASEGFDPRRDDLGLQCIPPGMPNAVLNPYPMELIDEGDRIVQRIEEWDARRVFYLNASAPPDGWTPDYLGFSVAHWEGNTLVIRTTQIDFPLLDGDGTPMSEDVEILERYTLSEDETRLEYEISVTDPANLVEPAVWEGAWAYRPGVEVQPFECTLPETVNPVYR